MAAYGLRQVAVGVHVVEARQRFFGLEVGTRMTVLALKDGLLVHSPVSIDPATLQQLGRPRWVLAPNLMHHLYVAPWVDAGLEAWAAPGLPEKRPDVQFAGIIESGASPFGDEVELLPLSCFPLTREVVVLHRPSKTLVVTDLVFNFSDRAPWLTRFGMWCLGGYPGCRTTLVERVGMRRELARKELALIAQWDFDRVIMAHGEVIERGGKSALIEAFRWLSIPPRSLPA